MKTELTSAEQHFFRDRVLNERLWELRLEMVALAVLGIACACGLLADWLGGIGLGARVLDLLWGGMLGGFLGAFVAWREKRWVVILKKIKRRLTELEAQIAVEQENGPAVEQS